MSIEEQKPSWFRPFQKIQFIRSEWARKTPKQKWTAFYRTGQFAADLVQIGVYHTDMENNRIGPIGYYPIFHAAGYIGLAIYTIYFHITRGQFAECIKIFCFFGILIQVYTMYTTVITELRYTWTKIMNLSGKYIYRDDAEPTVYNQICSRSMDESVKTVITIISLEGFSFVLANIGTFYSMLQGRKITLLSVHIPYIHHNPDIEFLINFCWETIGAIDGFASFIAIEIAFMLVNDTITVSSRLCEADLNDISDQLEKYQTAVACRNLKMVLRRTKFIDEFIDEFRELQYWRLFIGPIVLTFSMGISIYCHFAMGYYAGYGLAVTAWVQMAVMCYSGQNVVNRNDKLVDVYYNFKWYLLPKNDQKYVLSMIHCMQNGMDLTIGPLEQLNYETLKILTQKVYSFTMFLHNFEV